MRCMANLLIPAGLLWLTGCTIIGKWSLATIEPEAARRDFEFASLTCQKDGTFYAESQIRVLQHTEVQTEGGGSFSAEARESGIHTVSGIYTFKDGALTLRPHEGPVTTYRAAFKDANHLRLEKFWDGQKVRTLFTRVE